jgi:hypothetical protein
MSVAQPTFKYITVGKPLYKCAYLQEDDFSYLIDEDKWIKRLSYRLTPEEIRGPIMDVVRQVIHEMESADDKLDTIVEKVFSRGAEHTYLSEMKLPELDFNQRKEIEACFVSSILRHVILKEAKISEKDRAQFKERIVGEYAQFLENETGNDVELTWLFRFERTIVLAKTYIPGKLLRNFSFLPVFINFC